ncbi:transmembrane protein 138 isoform X4 [Callithrix jacchus]|uniref:transmembrane protein 138 isoform X4 n=1 Tax=Callithrix jacchus TaxID=9483 RepID=UPI0004F08715|nr:transmembrane protein 138 isoform X4 [Callithrix jacchus]
MLQTSNYSLVLSLQFLLLSYDLFVNSFSELLRKAPVVQLVLFIIQDIAVLFNIIIIFLMFFNTFVFQAGLVNLLFHKFKGTIILTAVYFALSISLHVWVMNLRWKNSNSFIWTDGLQALFVFQRLGFASCRLAWICSDNRGREGKNKPQYATAFQACACIVCLRLSPEAKWEPQIPFFVVFF